MAMFRAGLAVALVFIGGISAFLGAIVLFSALSSGSISISYGAGARAMSEVVTRAGDPARFMTLVASLGVAPLVLGALASWWGWRRLRG